MSFQRFLPKQATRGTQEYIYFELSLAQGPIAIGVTGDNELIDFIGYAWLLILDEDMMLHLFRQTATVGEWEEVTTDLPPVFDAALPEGSRRVSFAFDQSARVIVGYELDEVIYVTRWDTFIEDYVQNVTVAGVDPVIVFDATWAYDITSSDVLLFYLDAGTRTKVMARVQRDNYAIEYEMYDYGVASVLDRVIRLPWKYQVLVSDAIGNVRTDVDGRLALRSLLYPVAVDDEFGFAGALTEGDYIFSMFTEEPIEPVTFAAALEDGAYLLSIVDGGADDAFAFAAMIGSGSYILVVIDAAESEALGFEGEILDGEYIFSMFSLSGDDDFGFAASFDGGSYELG